jgi:hypothetical protein
MKAPVCKNCKYGLTHLQPKPAVKWREAEDEKLIICRRYPKHVLHEPDDWCGEYKDD